MAVKRRAKNGAVASTMWCSGSNQATCSGAPRVVGVGDRPEAHEGLHLVHVAPHRLRHLRRRAASRDRADRARSAGLDLQAPEQPVEQARSDRGSRCRTTLCAERQERGRRVDRRAPRRRRRRRRSRRRADRLRTGRASASSAQCQLTRSGATCAAQSSRQARRKPAKSIALASVTARTAVRRSGVRRRPSARQRRIRRHGGELSARRRATRRPSSNSDACRRRSAGREPRRRSARLERAPGR